MNDNARRQREFGGKPNAHLRRDIKSQQQIDFVFGQHIDKGRRVPDPDIKVYLLMTLVKGSHQIR